MIADLFSLSQLTPGRVRYALNQLSAEAQAAPGVADRIADLRAAATATVDVQKAYARSRGQSKARGAAVALDNQIDRTIGAIASVAQANMVALPADDPVHVAGAALLAKVLPRGVAAITTLPFEEELNAVKELIADVDAAGDLAAQAGVDHLIGRLRGLAPRFEAELAKQAAVVDFKQVQAAQAAMQRALMVLVAQLITAWPRPEEADALNAALAPIRAQLDAVRSLRRKRRAVTDVDPQTGAEVVADGPADAAPAEPADPTPVEA